MTYLSRGAFLPICINYNSKNDKKLYVLTRTYSFFNRMERSSINIDFDITSCLINISIRNKSLLIKPGCPGMAAY